MTDYRILVTCWIGCSLLLSCNGTHEPAKAPTPAASASQGAPSLNLIGSEWLLEDLGGSGVLDRVQATLAFPEAGKIAGRGTCNRFFGSAVIGGNTMKISAMGSTKMACPEALMKQEDRYLAALQAAERFESHDGNLSIYYTGSEKPLRFTPLNTSTPSHPDSPKTN